MSFNASKTYTILTTQPFTEALQAALPTGVGRYFEYGRDGIEPDMKCVPLQWRDICVQAIRAGRDIASGDAQYPDLSIVERWIAGEKIREEGFESSGNVIRKNGSSPNIRAIIIDGIILTSIDGFPEIRFPDDVRYVHNFQLQEIAESYRWLRKYAAKPQNARAVSFEAAKNKALKQPLGTHLRTLAESGDKALLQLWFGHRFTGTVLQTRMDMAFDARGTKATKWEWHPAVPADVRQCPVLYGNKYDKNTRYLLTPIEDAMLLKLKSADASKYQVWDISK